MAPRQWQDALADFTAGLKQVQWSRFAWFEQAALIAFLQSAWPQIDDDPDPVRWVNALIDSGRTQLLA